MQLFVNDLTVIDFSYLCPQRGIVGESWIVDIMLDGSLNDQSMVLDFGRVKKQIKAIIDQSVDHKLLVPSENPITHVTKHSNETHYWVDFLRPQNSIHLFCPADAYAFIDAPEIDMQATLSYLHAVIKKELPNNVKGLELKLRAENIPSFYYHYTHGLKKHDGNCQRIAHGHRSAIQVFVDGMRSPAWEQRWSRRWEDIYIGTAEDVVAPEHLTLSPIGKDMIGDRHVCYSYVAEQGIFELVLPAAENEVMSNDTTVECIAEYIAQEIKQHEPTHEIKVIAFEGVGKGAIGYA
ncbi:MAG: 6-carboxytetrahydropterin synthase [Aliidiomarina sp.]|uniref:6-carboxytetrahydropterin synthase n=1 Tax=Aliidiomarina sp. TaxID=1872439 RepID=UPI0025C64E16|nr:6-carboxytetrahydropterin synthase [Aliidiomarina sp.]MCH8501846.1 6-carboxytetrahydropterin synthase [Aliidiomarina sp.]